MLGSSWLEFEKICLISSGKIVKHNGIYMGEDGKWNIPTLNPDWFHPEKVRKRQSVSSFLLLLLLLLVNSLGDLLPPGLFMCISNRFGS